MSETSETVEARAKRLPGMQGAPERSMGFWLPINDPPRLDWSEVEQPTEKPEGDGLGVTQR